LRRGLERRAAACSGPCRAKQVHGELSSPMLGIVRPQADQLIRIIRDADPMPDIFTASQAIFAQAQQMFLRFGFEERMLTVGISGATSSYRTAYGMTASEISQIIKSECLYRTGFSC
jgi:hypothetical protein